MTRRIVLTVAALVIGGSVAEAGLFGKRYTSRSSETVCTSDGCGTTTATTRNVVRGSTATAQGVAEIQAAEGRHGHHGGHRGYEGVGIGSTPAAALGNCCNNGGRVVDEGVALGRDGRWYACRRYSVR
jgi:hypothetical protein